MHPTCLVSCAKDATVGNVAKEYRCGVVCQRWKDLSAAVESGRSVQQAMPVTSLSLALSQLADDQLGGLRTATDVVRYFLED